MKAAANGALNLSILDGWWPEAYNGTNGWAIGNGEEYEDTNYGDQAEATMLYELLENQVIPTFFDRGPDGLPHRWIDMMEHSMATVCVRFNSHRMVEEYIEDYYVQAALAHQILGENRLARARELSEWKRKARNLWKNVQVLEVTEFLGDRISLGRELNVKATIQLGGFGDQEVIVDLCYGPLKPDSDEMVNRQVTTMTSVQPVGDGQWQFNGTIRCDETGVYGYAIRLLPFHPYLFDPLSMNLVTWG
jgi:starch phosphorylase